MFEPQNIYQYMDNPMGKGSTAIFNRKYIQDDLNKRYYNLLKAKKDFSYSIYSSKDKYYFHFKIPSETSRENTYDVVLEFYIAYDEAIKNDTTIKRYNLRFFSNSPNFVYTYANVYKQYDLLITFLANKYPDVVLKEEPTIKNPGSIINYDKSLYFACMYITTHKELMNKTIIASKSKPMNVKMFSKLIRNSEQIMVEIKKEESKLTRAAKFKDKSILNKRKIDKPDNTARNDIGPPPKKTNKITPKKAKAKITAKPKVKPKKKI